MTENLVIDVDRKLDSDSLEAVLLVEISLDSHVEYIAQRDINIGDLPYRGVVKSVTGIKSSQEIDAGIGQSKTATIIFSNSEYKFSDFLEFQELYNRTVVIKEVLLDVAGTLINQGRTLNVMTGVVDAYSWDNDNFSISILDISRKIYSDLPKYTIQKSVWPNAVDVGKPYPIIGGLVTKVPIYLVDNVAYKYLACLIPDGHTIRSNHPDTPDTTFKVYYWENQIGSPNSPSGGDWTEVGTNNYVVSKTTDSNGVGVFIIDFFVPMDTHKLAIDIEGIEDTTPSTYTDTDGSLITNHADFVRFLFNNSDCLNVSTGDMNLPSFVQARSDLSSNYTNSPTLSMWIGAIKDSLFIMEDISLAMRRSMPSISDQSVIKLEVIPNAVTALYQFDADSTNIISPITISKKRITDLKNDITVNADFNHSENTYRLSSNKPSASSQTEYKTLKSFTYNCLTLANQAELDELAENLRDFEKSLPFIAKFTLNASGLNLSIGNIISLTHEQAPGKSAARYDGSWTFGGKEFFYGKNIYEGWYKERGKVLLLNKKKTSVDVEMEMI